MTINNRRNYNFYYKNYNDEHYNDKNWIKCWFTTETYLGAAGQNEKYIIKKEWISQSSKYFHSSWKMT